MKNILVTGGFGFIGYCLVKKLIALGHEVTILDNRVSDKMLNLKAKIFIGDIRDKNLLMKLLKNSDVCYHLAAILPNISMNSQSEEIEKINFLATDQLFKIAESLSNKPIIIYASSSAVYGNKIKLPLSEIDFVKPISSYGLSKLNCEISAKYYNLRTIGLRFFNIYGPNQSKFETHFGVIPYIINQLKSKKPIEIYGNGEETRDFIYIEDAIEVMILLMDINFNINKSEVINICSGIQTSINNLLSEIMLLTNSSSKITYIKKQSNHIDFSFGNNLKAFKLLNWKAKTELKTGLLKTIQGI